MHFCYLFKRRTAFNGNANELNAALINTLDIRNEFVDKNLQRMRRGTEENNLETWQTKAYYGTSNKYQLKHHIF